MNREIYPVPYLFDIAFTHLMYHEGGYVFDKNDAGGETKFGISKRTYPNLDIKNLTMKAAKQIYYCDYWMKGKFENILDEDIAIKLFDLSVNMGFRQATKCIQRALRSVGYIVSEDGIIGSETLSSINAANPQQLYCALKSESAGFYRLLAISKPNNSCFLTGWLNRAYSDIYKEIKK